MLGNLKKALLVIVLGIFVSGSCVASEIDFFNDKDPFLSSRDVYQCLENLVQRKEKNSIKIIKQRIEVTMDYFESLTDLPDLTRFTPGLENWKKAKLIEALSAIKGCFGDIEIVSFCLTKMTKICCLPENDTSKVEDKNYRCARYLIMSQCTEYDESKNIYQFSKDYSKSTLSEAIGMLTSAENGDMEKSETLLESLRRSGMFKSFFG